MVRRLVRVVVVASLLAAGTAVGFAPTAQAVVGGPIVLMGIDAEDCGTNGAHGPIANYIQLVTSILADVTNGNTGGILVLGGNGSCQTGFWDAIGAATGNTVTYVEGAAAITAQSFSGFELLAVSGSDATTSGGMTQAENDALAARKLEVAAFINAGGGLIGFDQTFLTNPFDYLATVGTFVTSTGDYSNIDPTADGQAVGVNDSLDVSFWHERFTQWPSFLSVLAFVGGTQQAAALGGEAVVVSTEDCNNGVDDDNDGLIDDADPDCHPQGEGQSVSGMKYYDVDTDGTPDAGEVGIANWMIDVTNGTTQSVLTDANGDFSVAVDPGTYDVSEQQAPGWLQTGPATGFYDDVVVAANQDVTDLDFGNVCIGNGDARTKGFWQNKNGQADFTGGGGLAIVNALPLFNATGPQGDFASYNQFRDWIRKASAKNPRYMLSAQLAAMVLNVEILGVDDSRMVFAPLVENANAAGFIQLAQLIADAIAALQDASATTAELNALSDALNAANNNLTFVQAGPEDCPDPVFAFVAFSDNFNHENGATPALNYSAFTNWNVTDGTVDLIGPGLFNLYPGNGFYVDLDGSTGDAGVLATKTTFSLPPGTYELRFDLGGSQRATTESVTVKLGTVFDQTYVRNSGDPLAQVIETIVVTVGENGVLSFENAGGDDVGAVLDDVSLQKVA